MTKHTFSYRVGRWQMVLAAVLVVLPAPAAHATEFWKNSVVTGNWGDANSWSATSAAGIDNGGVPTGGDVNIVNSDSASRTVTLNVNTPNLNLVTINQTGASGLNTLLISNNFSASALFVGGWSGGVSGSATTGRGAVNQSAGIVTMASNTDLVVGHGLGSTGTYTLSGGTFTAPQSEYIGLSGSGTFNQSGGTNTINAGGNAASTFNLGDVGGSNGAYNLSGPILTSLLTATKMEVIGDAGTGVFTQTGGTNTVGINPSTSATNDLSLGRSSGGVGTYAISSGAANVSGSVYLGGSAAGGGGTGTLNISGTGVMTIGAELIGFSGASGSINLSGGTLNAKSINVVSSAFHWTSGTLNITQSFVLGLGTVTGGGSSHIANSLGSPLTLGTAQTLSTTGSETVGGSTNGYNLTLNSGSSDLIAGTLAISRAGGMFQNGGAVTANAMTVGDDAISGSTFQQTNGTNTIATSLQIGTTAAGANGSYTLGTSGTLLTASEQLGVLGNGIFSQNGGVNNVTNDLTVGVSGSGTASFDMNGGTTAVGGNVLIGQSSGIDEMTISGAGGINVSGTLQVANKSTASLNLTGGSITTSALNFNGAPSHFKWTEGTLNLPSVTWDPFASSNSTGSAFGRALSLGNFQTLNVTGTESLGSIGSFLLTLASGGRHTVSGVVTINSQSELRLDGGTLIVGGLTNSGGTFNFLAGTLGFTGAGLNNNVAINSGANTTINVFANNVSLGSATSFAGFNHAGTLTVGGNTVTLNSAGYARLGVLTTMSGGTINAPNGVTLASGSNFQGSGAVNARVAGESGSVIEASGNLQLGDATSAAGFNFGGELRTKQFTVTLNSSAPVGLGNLTTLGNGSTAGTLSASNGFVADFDEAITGFGTINSSNTLAKHATINGTVQGTSVSQPITLSGYIKGTGTFTNVTFTGTFSPGLSPNLTSAGNLALAPSSTLEMELGGTTAGSSYDEIQATGALALGGTLNVSLINGFVPSAGQSFDILDWGSLSGTFSSISLPALSGLTWNTSQLYTTGVISLASASLPGDFNHDGTVNAADYVVLRKGFGTTYSQSDYDTWRANFGAPSGSGSGGSLAGGAVPEPRTWWLVGLAIVCKLAIQRTRPVPRRRG